MLQSLLPFIIAGLATGSVLGLAGTGLVLTYKTSGIFNFGYGAIAAAAAYVFYWLNVDLGLPWWIAFLVSVVGMGVVFGIVFEFIGRALSAQRVAFKVVATIGLILFVQGIATAIWGYDPLRIPQWIPKGSDSISIADVYISYSQLVIILVSLLAVAGLYTFFRWSRLGLAMRAVVDDPDLVGLQGTDSRKVQLTAWMIGGTLAAMSGVLIAPSTGVEAVALTFLVVQAFGAAAIGGFSSIPWTYVGAMAIGLAMSLTTKYVLDFPVLGGLPAAIPFLVLIVALLVTPKRRLSTPSRAERSPTVPWKAPTRVRWTALTVALILLIIIPNVVGTALPYYTVGLATAVLLLSLGLLVKTSGLVSLSHAAFAAIGAVAFAQLINGLNVPWLAALIGGALIVVPVAAVLALPAIRLSGLFLALVTFGFGLTVEAMFYSQDWFFTSAGTGRTMPRPTGFEGDIPWYYVVLFFLVLTALVMMGIERMRLGRILRGMSESSTAMRTLGLNLNFTRLIVFCIAGFLAGIGGVLYGSTVHFAIFGDAKYSAFASLVLITVLAVSPGRVPWFAVVAAVASVIPAYIKGEDVLSWMNVIFGFFAIVVAMQGGTAPMPMLIQNFFNRFEKAPTADTDKAATHEAARELVSRPNSRVQRSGLEVRDLSIHYGGTIAVDGVSFVAAPGKITGLIGPNGAGKTSTFNAISGLVRPNSGQVILHGDDVTSASPALRGRRGLGRTFQLMQLCDTLTVAENVSLGMEAPLAGTSLRGQLFASRSEARKTAAAVSEALHLCGIAHLSNRQAGTLSTGQRRLLELARCLAGPFDMLLLDEPSSGLDPTETEAFGTTLRTAVEQRGCGILLVEHDMALVMDICHDIYVLDFGRMLFHGSPQEVRNSVIVQEAYLGTLGTDESDLSMDVSR